MILFEGADNTFKIKGYTQLEAYIVSFDFWHLTIAHKISDQFINSVNQMCWNVKISFDKSNATPANIHTYGLN